MGWLATVAMAAKVVAIVVSWLEQLRLASVAWFICSAQRRSPIAPQSSGSPSSRGSRHAATAFAPPDTTVAVVQ
jgi:hypothetical protein